jgi:hypothetical protein
VETLARLVASRPARAAVIAVVVVAAAVAVILAPAANSQSTGITGQTRSGCTCHNATESPAVTPGIEGLPGLYDPGKVYKLTITAGGGATPGTCATVRGGFDLLASAGVLQVPKGSTLVRIDPATGEATHTLEGARDRTWTVEWRAPSEDAGTVTLTLAVNTVNGDGSQMPGDQWGRGQSTTEPAGAGGLLDVPLFWKVLGTALVIGVVAAALFAVGGPRIVRSR